MSETNPSLVSSELTTIETFKDTTEKRGSKLTLNELNYISDKQLHSKGGSGNSPVGLAKVKFAAVNMNITLDLCFSNLGSSLPVYFSADDEYAETTSIFPSSSSIVAWNDRMDRGGALIAPYILYKRENAEYTFEGDAEFGADGDGEYIYIKGDCTITIDGVGSNEPGQL